MLKASVVSIGELYAKVPKVDCEGCGNIPLGDFFGYVPF